MPISPTKAAAVITAAVTAAVEAPNAPRGMAIYQDRCASCHGTFGRGDGAMSPRLPVRPTSLADGDVVGRLSPDEAFLVVTEGRLANGMPPWKDALSDTQRWDALFAAWSYYYTPERLARGRAVWDARCASCHTGADGSGPGLAAIAAWDRLRRIGQTEWVRRVANPAQPAASHAALERLGQGEVALALDYVRGRSFRPLAYESLVPGGAISGKVLNGTSDAAPLEDPSALVLRVIPFATEGMVPGLTMTPTVAGDGSFHLDDLLAGQDLGYHLVASYKDVDYVYPSIIRPAAPPSAAADVEVTVFEPSEDAGVDVALLELILAPEPEGGWVSVAEVWLLENRTKTSRVPGKSSRPTMRLPIEAGASQVNLDDPRAAAAARIGQGQVELMDAMPPGRREVALTYAISLTGPTLVLDRVLDAGADEVAVRVVGEGLRLQGEGLTATAATTVTSDGIVLPVQTWTAAGLRPGARLHATLSGLPSPPAFSIAWVNPNWLAGFGAALAVAGILCSLVYPFLGRAAGRPGAGGKEAGQ